MDESKGKRSWTQVLSYLLIVSLTVECGLLIVQNRDLKHSLSTTTSMGGDESLKPGESVESFRVETLDGNATVLSYHDSTKRHLFFVLSTTCPHCEKTLPAWNLISKSNHENIDIFGISIHNLEETKRFVGSRDVEFYSVSVGIDTSFSRKYKVSGVPETMLIDQRGIVEKVWVGELSSEQVQEIQNLIGAHKAPIN